MRLNMRYIESAEQCVFVKWFKLQYPQFRKLIYKIDNEGSMKPHIGKLKNDLGRLGGAPDLCIAVPTKDHPGLYIEMKSIIDGKRSSVSKVQLEVHEELRNVGYKVEVCWTADEAIQVVKGYFL